MDTTVVEVRTGSPQVVHDLGEECRRFLGGLGPVDGLLHVWVPHATAGLAVIETGSGSDDGLVALGTWQSVCLVDLNVDNPVRRVRLSFLAG